MNVYDEQMSGGVGAFGCATVDGFHTIQTRYGPGDEVYNVNKARRGILEKIVIKQAHYRRNKQLRRPAVVIYQDTLNSLWNEYDLVWKEQAVAIATAYLERYQAFLDSQTRCVP